MACRYDRWAIGLPALAAIVVAASWRFGPVIEDRLRDDLAADGFVARLAPGTRIEVAGRDLRLIRDGDVPPSSVAGVVPPGVRAVRFAREAPAAVAPFTFSATRAGGRIVLAGHVPPGEDRAGLVRPAPTAFAFDDRTRAALGAPAGFDDAARFALDLAQRLDPAEIVLVDAAIRVAGTAADDSSYDAALARIRDVPAGFRVESAIVPPLATPFVWSAETRDRRVRLAGHVPSEADRAAILAAAGPGAEDAMRTARGLDPAIRFDAMAGAALGWLARLETGRVALAGRDVEATGTTPARDRAQALGEALRGALPAALGTASVTVSAVPAVPFRFAARRGEGRLVLSGYMPEEADRARLAEIAARRYPFEALDSDVALADGAPPGMATAAALALVRLASLADGEAVLADRSVALSGRALYPELAARSRRDFAEGWPDGWTVSVAIAAGAGERRLDDGVCADLVADSLRREPLLFEPGQAEFGPAGRRGFDALAAILRRCGPVPVRILAWGEGAAADLARRRVEAVVARLGPAAPDATLRPAPAVGRGEADRVAVEIDR